MTLNLSERIAGVGASKTTRFIPLIQKMKNRGEDVISLAIGEPEYHTPDPIIASVKNALDNGKTKYGPVSGLNALKEKISSGLNRCTKDHIIVSNGSKQSLFMIFQVICNPGDHVVIPRPCWVSFSEQVKLAGAVPVFVDTIGHQLDIDAIQQAVTPKTKAILINSPNNPSGAIYPMKDLEKVAQIAVENDFFLVSDEAYRCFVYDNIIAPSPVDIEGIADRLVITRSFSKHYCMTGFRTGYVAASRPFVKAMSTLQSHLTGNVCTFAQYGAMAALDMDDRFIKRWVADLEEKRDLAFEMLSPVFDCIKPEGAFYMFPDVTGHLANGETSGEFAARILEKAGVAVVPGEDFGKQGHIRISFAARKDLLVRALEKIKEVL